MRRHSIHLFAASLDQCAAQSIFLHFLPAVSAPGYTQSFENVSNTILLSPATSSYYSLQLLQYRHKCLFLYSLWRMFRPLKPLTFFFWTIFGYFKRLQISLLFSIFYVQFSTTSLRVFLIILLQRKHSFFLPVLCMYFCFGTEQ